MPIRSILGMPGTLDLHALQEACIKPPLWAQHESAFWDDPHIAKQMMVAHLHPDWDSASRPHAVISRSVEWLVDTGALRAGQRLLDLGCGPGLYCTRFARKGVAVTGMDYSRNSIAYARGQAEEEGLPITYVYQDYTTMEYEAEFDAISIINLDFCVLSDNQRDGLLERMHKALKPGGFFVLDVQTAAHKPTPEGTQSWAIAESGFWSPTQHMVLSQNYIYPETDVDLEQVVVVEQDGAVKVYRLWMHSYTEDSISVVLGRFGLAVTGIWGDLTGTPYLPEATVMGIVARKPVV